MDEDLFPSLENIKQALKGDIPENVITQEVLDLCHSLFTENGIDTELPVPNSSYVKKFTEIAGPENNKTTRRVSGCYLLYSPFLEGSYIGHSIVLGKRVKDHAKAKDSTTSLLVKSFDKKGRLTIWKVIPETLPKYISLQEFLVVFEQFLFFSVRPTCNKSLIATPGITHSPDSFIKHMQKIGKPLFVYLYIPSKSCYYLLHTFQNTSAFSHLLNVNRK